MALGSLHPFFNIANTTIEHFSCAIPQRLSRLLFRLPLAQYTPPTKCSKSCGQFARSNTMHDSVKRSAAAGQRGRQSSANMFDFNDPYMTSPDSVQVKTEPQDYAHQSTFPYDMAHGLPLTPSVSAHGWQDQSIPGTTACYNTAVSAPDYSGLAYYQEQQYPVPSMIDSMQYPVFTSSGQVQALYYQSGFGVNQNCHPDYAQIPSRRWPMTPQSHIGTPERTQHPSPTENTWPSPILSDENVLSKRRTSNKNVSSVSRAHLGSLERSPSHETESTSSSVSSQERSYYGSVSPRTSATEVGSSRREKSASRGQAQAELDPGLRCPLCDKVFTRRSNCREHLKRHNPGNRQAHSCSSCGKTFGRKTDLKRHYLTVSLPMLSKQSLYSY